MVGVAVHARQRPLPHIRDAAFAKLIGREALRHLFVLGDGGLQDDERHPERVVLEAREQRRGGVAGRQVDHDAAVGGLLCALAETTAGALMPTSSVSAIVPTSVPTPRKMRRAGVAVVGLGAIGGMAGVIRAGVP